MSKKHTKKKTISFVAALILFLATVALAPALLDLLGSKSQASFPQHLSPLLSDHIQKTLNYIYRNINPETSLAYSLPGDDRLKYWSVVYDDAMRAIAHIQTGDIPMAKKTIDYFMKNTAIQKIGYVYKEGKMVRRPGWVINIVDASELRAGGRGIEHIAHVGPNAFLGIASLHLFRAVQEKKYLDFARHQWLLIKDLQNENPQDFNYGGVRMGPLGNPNNPQEQRLDFKSEKPSFYDFYNGEHAADFKALTDLLAQIDLDHQKEYLRASQLIAEWDKKIYDTKTHLFYIGTTEKRYFDSNMGRWVKPGVVPQVPLDTTALKICAYGVKGLENFEAGGAEKIRRAIDQHFKVTINTKITNETVRVTGFDFISDTDRSHLILYEEEGPLGDVKVKKGVGRVPLLTDEWTTWVAFADLRMAKDFRAMGETAKAEKYLNSYKTNARDEGLKTGDHLDENTIAYPYVHPIPEGFNKPVGFGWNTHHRPYSMIGGVARILGIMGADPYSLDGEALEYKADTQHLRLAERTPPEMIPPGLVTEAELYLNEAWSYVRIAQQRGTNEEENWVKAAATIERMGLDHPDWIKIAQMQNQLAKNSGDKYPLQGMSAVSVQDLEPVFRKYWALYHVGTGEFIRVMAYSELANLAKGNNDSARVAGYQQKAKEAADRILFKYTFAQAYDKTGWLWQPVDSLREYVDDTDEKISPI